MRQPPARLPHPLNKCAYAHTIGAFVDPSRNDPPPVKEEFAPERCNALALRQATRHVSRLYDRCLAPFGLRGTQFSIVARLSRAGPRSINDLARDLVMDRTTLGRNLRPLERSGLVSLAVDAGDRRSRLLAVTERGRALFEQARPAWQTAQQQFEKSFGRDEAAALRALLRTVTRTRLAPPRRPTRAETES